LFPGLGSWLDAGIVGAPGITRIMGDNKKAGEIIAGRPDCVSLAA